MGNYFFRIKDADLEKLMVFLQQRKKSNFVAEAINFYLKNEKEEEIKKFINPLFFKEFTQLLKKIKGEKWKN